MSRESIKIINSDTHHGLFSKNALTNPPADAKSVHWSRGIRRPAQNDEGKWYLEVRCPFSDRDIDTDEEDDKDYLKDDGGYNTRVNKDPCEPAVITAACAAMAKYRQSQIEDAQAKLHPTKSWLQERFPKLFPSESAPELEHKYVKTATVGEVIEIDYQAIRNDNLCIGALCGKYKERLVDRLQAIYSKARSENDRPFTKEERVEVGSLMDTIADLENGVDIFEMTPEEEAWIKLANGEV
ncbi:hypothetical protein FWF74_02860 [Candidatus Saccharibacteria bacterium]|nr:hypothetical protein [Candidatus Saccharibacteria bacterium]MCL1962670.1 hypothetical protein [Candidatus Saccharibacteria bacterium]